jgi:hypothetical protein
MIARGRRANPAQDRGHQVQRRRTSGRLPLARRNALAVLLLVLGLGACTDSLGPGVTEPLALNVRVRPLLPGERLPMFEVNDYAGAVRVQVARPDLACTLAEASVSRVATTLTVVARVRTNPVALCARGWVVEYSGVIENLVSGRYHVRIYEAEGSGRPVLIGTKTITARGP